MHVGIALDPSAQVAVGDLVTVAQCDGGHSVNRQNLSVLCDGRVLLVEGDRDAAAPALDSVSQEWPDPAGYGPPVSDQMTTEKRMTAAVALRKAEVDATRAVRFEKEGRQGEALALWRDILGRYFPSA